MESVYTESPLLLSTKTTFFLPYVGGEASKVIGVSVAFQ